VVVALMTRIEPKAAAGPAAKGARASTLLGLTTLTLLLIVGVPIFLCMPVWFDTYHYDICIRTWQRGGVLYRDVFDNNLPGIIWLQGAVRLLVGWRTDAIRIVDLIFFSVGVLLLLRWVARGARVWTAVALYAFYLFTPESCPCERDMWMLLPALAALTLRRRQVRRLGQAAPAVLSVVGWAALEGLCWAAGVWIKPFVFVPAFACWFAGFALLRSAHKGTARRLAADAAGLLAGGVLAGALGLMWLWQSGSWPYFWAILIGWNRDYAAFANRLRPALCFQFLLQYLPWSLVPIAAAYLAGKTILRELVDGPTAKGGSDAPWPCRAVLGAFFLGWLFQAVFLQLPHDYTLVPALVSGVVVVAACWRWRPPSSSVKFAAGMGFVALMALLWAINFRLYRVAYWPECWREGSTPRMQSLLATQRDYAYAPDPAALAPVADYLRCQGVGDGELTCMSGCTHPLYLDLNVRPSTRFPQVEMTTLFFIHHRDEVLAEVNASRQRFIVSDLVWTGLTAEEAEEINPADPLALPRKFPDKYALTYPWNEPVVFRSGRYVVHRATGYASRFWRENATDEPRPLGSGDAPAP